MTRIRTFSPVDPLKELAWPCREHRALICWWRPPNPKEEAVHARGYHTAGPAESQLSLKL